MTDAGANSLTTDAKWTNGRSYTSGQIKQLAATLAAMTMAYYPRDATEMSAVPWDSVANFASQGISSGARFDFEVVADGCSSWCPDHLAWFDEVGSGRINTRIAHLLDPATQADPWPLTGNPQPHSADARLGDGTFGDGTLPAARRRSRGTPAPVPTSHGERLRSSVPIAAPTTSPTSR